MRKTKCPDCHKLVAVREGLTIRQHGGKQLGYGQPCIGSGKAVEYQDTQQSFGRAEAEMRVKIAEEIRGIIPPPWTNELGPKFRAQAWREVADFVERSGEWEGYDV